MKICKLNKSTLKERRKIMNFGKTNFFNLANMAFDKISDDLELEREYKGIIKKIYVEKGMYSSIIILYEINDNGMLKHINDVYTFNGDYDYWYMEQLVKLLKQVNNLCKDDIDWANIDTICKSLEFLIGEEIRIKQSINSQGKRKNEVKLTCDYKMENLTIDEVL